MPNDDVDIYALARQRSAQYLEKMLAKSKEIVSEPDDVEETPKVYKTPACVRKRQLEYYQRHKEEIRERRKAQKVTKTRPGIR